MNVLKIYFSINLKWCYPDENSPNDKNDTDSNEDDSSHNPDHNAGNLPTRESPFCNTNVSDWTLHLMTYLLLIFWILNWYMVLPFSLAMEILWTVSESFTFSLLMWRRATYWLGSLSTFKLWFWVEKWFLLKWHQQCYCYRYTHIANPASRSVSITCFIETQGILEVIEVPGQIPRLRVGVERNHEKTFLAGLQFLLSQRLYHVWVGHWGS